MFVWLLPSLSFASPTVPDCAVLRPTYTIDGTSSSAGLMWATTHEDQTLLVAPHHIFGPGGGHAVQLSPFEAPRHVSAVVAHDAYRRVECARAEDMLIVPTAESFGNTAAKDIALFVRKKAVGFASLGREAEQVLHPLPIAQTRPKIGDAVWIAAPSGPSESKLIAAKIVYVDAKFFDYKLEDSSRDLTGIAGAPVLNQDGHVVAMHLASGKQDDGSLVAGGNPAGAMRALLATARPAPEEPTAP